MSNPSPEHDLPHPPENLAFGRVRLRLDRIVPGDAVKGLVPYYHFHILNDAGTRVGHLNLRVGDTEHLRVCAGHLGYMILEPFRGHNYAYQACRAVAPFLGTLYPEVLITCNPDNVASKRIIEQLGAEFIDEVEVPPHDPGYKNGARRKLRYRWAGFA